MNERPPSDSRDTPTLGSQTSPSGYQRYSVAPDAEPWEPKSEPPRSRTRRVLLIAGSVFLGSILIGILSLLAIFYRYSSDLPNVHQLGKTYAPPQMTRILARDGTLLGSIFTERRTVVPLSSLPDHVKTAFLAAEDAGFFEHRGLNYLGLVRALVQNLRSGSVRQGGSTITQQVVKNVLLSSSRTYERKVKETVLAFRIERELTKEQILEIYLNQIYFGHGRYGIEEAARVHFGKRSSELTLPEAALLAGIVAAPERFSPQKDRERALKRRHYVLDQMRKKGFMTPEVFEVADKSPLWTLPAVETESDIAPEIVERARRALEQQLGEVARRGGYTVTTSIDPGLQEKARTALRKGLDDYMARHKLAPPFTLKKRNLWGELSKGKLRRHGIYLGSVVRADDEQGILEVDVAGRRGQVRVLQEERYNPGRLAPSKLFGEGAAVRVRVKDDPDEGDDPLELGLELGPEGALVALDARTLDVVALVGSYEALPGGLDRSTQARRQPGSSFKPVVYGAALEAGKVTAATVFEFDDPKAETKKRLTLREGIAQSDNRVAIETLHRVGAKNVIDFGRRVGFLGKLGEGDSLALGAYESTPLEMAQVFSVFCRGGQLGTPRFILSVESGSGPVEMPPRPEDKPVVRPEVAYLMTDLLTSVVKTGTGRRAQSLGRPVAGKTGTTNKAKDAWFVGFSTDYIVSVWVGYDDALPLGPGESGAVSALPIWTEFMRRASEGKPAIEFARPPGLVEVQIDPDTGLLAPYGDTKGRSELFLAGTEPTQISGTFGEAAPSAPEESEPSPSRSEDSEGASPSEAAREEEAGEVDGEP
ncbi:MAG: hypothetical protein B6A08_01010 [Sorangiineae bacterium NIC37A_2]|mgnify:CR=1 FL=1|jgi:penicillin-binding protein 1A|nr:MAG: hypothetical protein B6A08_01010 [Sorangiineae bacterium NIC37A_2]